MPTIRDYSAVLHQMQSHGMRCLYHNSGAFALPQKWAQSIVAWVGPPDPTIRPEALPLVRQIRPPYERELAVMAQELWTKQFFGPAWLMPMSHWAFECGQTWMPPLLQSIGVKPNELAGRNDAAAIDFGPTEQQALIDFLSGLLTNLITSDFTLAFPGYMTLCSVHHHKQLWWATQDAPVLAAIESLAKRFAAPESK